jgi:peptidoglycan/xylan/chitin deacetylase (PgdA/CDA1 family)
MEVYSADRSWKGKVRRRYAKLVHRRPARVNLTKPMVTFAFDDAPATAAQVGAEILEARGLKGTYFVAAGLQGQDSPFGLYASEDDAKRLLEAGHEIACHTYSHLDCGKATGPKVLADVEQNLSALEALGVQPKTFAYPYGDVSPAAKKAIGGRFGMLRALHHGVVEDGSDLNQAPAIGIEGPEGELTALNWLREASRKRAWVILFTHDVSKTPSRFGCTPGALERLCDAALSMGFEVVTAAEGAERVSQ